MRSRTLGIALAFATFIVDQACKAWMLQALARAGRKPVELLPVLDLQLAWNTGISYSLLRADGPLGRTLLVCVALAAVAGLSIWLARARRPLIGAALGLLIGGAAGNALDRILRGAVVDFFHLHWAGVAPFGVFNVADMAITGGALLLLAEALLLREKPPSAESREIGSASRVDPANKMP